MLKGKKLVEWASATHKDHYKTFLQLRKLPVHDVTELFHTAHEHVFKSVQCLECANCCTTTPALVNKSDSRRIAQYLHITVKDFFAEYLYRDEDGDYVFKAVPCVFLGKDNYCSIYEVRPESCREYPHTQHPKMNKQLLDITFKNREICPAVIDIIEMLKESLE